MYLHSNDKVVMHCHVHKQHRINMFKSAQLDLQWKISTALNIYQVD